MNIINMTLWFSLSFFHCHSQLLVYKNSIRWRSVYPATLIRDKIIFYKNMLFFSLHNFVEFGMQRSEKERIWIWKSTRRYFFCSLGMNEGKCKQWNYVCKLLFSNIYGILHFDNIPPIFARQAQTLNDSFSSAYIHKANFMLIL